MPKFFRDYTGATRACQPLKQEPGPLVDPLSPGDYNPPPLAEAMHLILSRRDYDLILEQVRAEWPNEACGLLGGEGGKVRRVYPVENIFHSPRAYQMNSVEQVRAMLEIEVAGWELSGIFHSHPSGSPFPSATDVAQAYYPDSLYLILAPDAHGEWQSRAFQIQAGHVEEAVVQVVEGADSKGL